MEPTSMIALVSALVREVGVPVVRTIAAGLRKDGHAELADTMDKLAHSDAILDDVISTSKREQNR